MSARARVLAKQALIRVFLGSALLIAMPYAIGFLIDGMSNKQTDVLVIGGTLFREMADAQGYVPKQKLAA